MALHKHSVVLIDDHEIVRAGLAAIISAEPDLQVVAQCADASIGLRSILDLRPQVAIIDINMPGASSFEAVQEAVKHVPGIKIIFLTAYDTDTNLERALQCGGAGFVTKSESLTSIVSAVREVLSGQTPYLSRDVRGRVVANARSMVGTVGQYGSAYTARKSLLSPREKEILCCVAQGQSAKQIANLLTISAKTVERHKSNIMTKLQLHTQVDLTRYAIREGMIAP